MKLGRTGIVKLKLSNPYTMNPGVDEGGEVRGHGGEGES